MQLRPQGAIHWLWRWGGKSPGIRRLHDHQTPRNCGLSQTINKTINKTSKMAGRPEFLSVLRRVGFSMNNGNVPSLNFKQLQVKCFESILKGLDVIGALTDLGSRCYFTAVPFSPR